jgi:hypothetical protein
MVVFPQPDGPRNEKNSPGLIDTLTRSTARNLPKSADTPSSSTPALIPWRFSERSPKQQTNVKFCGTQQKDRRIARIRRSMIVSFPRF